MNESYLRYYKLVEDAIKARPVNGFPDELYQPVNYMMSLGGKRLRPVLVLMGCELYQGNVNDALPAALAVEVFHNFTLVHDDIMDKALIRRGKPTVHVKWNETVAILSGDLMMIKATDLLCESPSGELKKLIRLFNQTAIEVCEGQQIDMNFETRQDVSEEEYLHMISLKTAVLLGCSLQLGAIIGGATAEESEALYQFGKHIGIAFQIQDDILDSFGEGEQTGKKVGGDISSNKKTLLLIHARNKANAMQASEIDRLIKLAADDTSKISGMLSIYNELSVREHAEKLKQVHLQMAFEFLKKSGGMPKMIQMLENTAIDLMERMS